MEMTNDLLQNERQLGVVFKWPLCSVLFETGGGVVMMKTFGGIPIIKSSLIPEFSPKMKLSEDVDVSDNFRNEFNSWLIGFFGEERTIYFYNHSIATHPQTYRLIERLSMNNEFELLDELVPRLK